MRTRKRLRDRSSKKKPAKPAPPAPGDFLEEDYQKVLDLLKKQNQGPKRRRLADTLQEDRFSTEADLDHHKGNKSPSENESGSSYSSMSMSKSSDSCSSGEQSKSKGKSRASKEGPKTCQPGQNSNASVKLEESKVPETTKKRTLKRDFKMTAMFNEFYKMIKNFNQVQNPEVLPKDFTKEMATFESSEAVPNRQIDTRKNPEEQFSTPQGSQMSQNLQNSESKTQEKESEKVQMPGISQKLDESASEKQPERSGEEAVGLIQPEQTSQETHAQNQENSRFVLTTSTGYALSSNQSLHARCAYMILHVQKQIYAQKYRLMMQKEYEMLQQYQSDQQNEAVKIEQAGE